MITIFIVSALLQRLVAACEDESFDIGVGITHDEAVSRVAQACLEGLKGAIENNIVARQDRSNTEVTSEVRKLVNQVKSLKSDVTRTQDLKTKPSPKYTCPKGWERHENDCYKLFTVKKQWIQAHHSCVRVDGRAHLASINRRNNDFVLKYVKNASKDYRIWLGLFKLTGDTWLWTDGTTLDFSNWGRGQPSNSNKNEHCGHLWPRMAGGKWNDIACKTYLIYLCQLRLR